MRLNPRHIFEKRKKTGRRREKECSQKELKVCERFSVAYAGMFGGEFVQEFGGGALLCTPPAAGVARE